MNQILDYSPNKNSGGNSSRTDKIVRVFAVLLILFAICLLAVGGYGYFKKNAENKQAINNVPTKAKISVEQGDSDITIKIEHDKVIQEVVYSWDDQKNRTIKGEGKINMDIPIPAVAGDHTLHIKVTDIDNVESTYDEVISSSSGEDKMNPTIDFKVVDVEEDGQKVRKIRIIAKDETALDYVTYRWNDEEETRKDVEEENQKEIEFEIDIPHGQNNLVIVAVDKGNNNTSLPKQFSGVTRPEVKINVSADRTVVDITCSHENGLKTIEGSINDQPFQAEIPDENSKELTFQLPLSEGTNKLSIKVTSVDNTETVKEQNIDNTPEQPNQDDEIDIQIEKRQSETEGLGEVAYVNVNTSGIVKEIRLNVNEVDYAVPIESEGAGFSFEVPIEDGNNVVSVTVVTQNGAEKTETEEIRR